MTAPSDHASARALISRVGDTVDAEDVRARAASAARLPPHATGRDRVLGAISCLDLTSLDGTETSATVRALAAKAVRPSSSDASIPHVAAVCLHPHLVADAAGILVGTGVKVAAVAGDFPSGQAPLAVRLTEIEKAVADGAGELDVVIDRMAFLRGDEQGVFDGMAASVHVAAGVPVKAILEVGELGSLAAVRRAALLAVAAGAAMIKTSTGKAAKGASLPAAMVMAEAIRDFERVTGRKVGLKIAGGVRTTEDALRYQFVAADILGPEWSTPSLWRIGASSLLDDLVREASVANRLR